MKGVQNAEAEWFRTTLHGFGDGVVATDRDGRILHMNPAAEDLCGRRDGEATGKPVEQVLRFVCQSTRAEVQNPVMHAMACGATVDSGSDTLLIAPDGGERPVATSAVPIRDSSGNIEGFVLVVRDRTAGPQDESAIRESEEKLRLLFERMSEGVAVQEVVPCPQGLPAGYAVVAAHAASLRQTKLAAESQASREGGGRLRFTASAIQVGFFDWACKTDEVHYSPEWKQQLGYEDDEISDEFREWQDRLHPDDAGGAVAQVRAYLASPHPNFRNEFRLRHKDGSYRWILSLASLTMDAAGTPEHMVGCHVDITDRKQAEQEVMASNARLEERVHDRTVALEAANSELQAFAYSISHDLRAPLRGIDGLAAILAEDHGEALGAEGKALCKRINENARRMGQLIDDLLAYSRLGRADIHRTEIDMSAMAKSVFHELAGEAAPERLLFHMEPLPAAYGDPSLVQQVWVNLIGNALKFSSKREQAVIEVGGASTGDEQVYYVRDNGAGFDMQYGDKLFGVFQRLHAAGEFDGTGVGLAIVQRVVQRHGGRAWAVGEVDRGATVYFSLPAKA